MNLANTDDLSTCPLTGVWYRGIPPSHWRTALDTAHTARYRSRFSPGRGGAVRFELLYLCANCTVLLEEVHSQFRDPTTGDIFARPPVPLLVPVNVSLGNVVDLTKVSQQQIIETNAQEITGDWRAYGYRRPESAVPEPVGLAPTQELGQALFETPRVEAFLYTSAKRPDHCNLAVFPQKLQAGSSLAFTNPITNETAKIAP